MGFGVSGFGLNLDSEAPATGCTTPPSRGERQLSRAQVRVLRPRALLVVNGDAELDDARAGRGDDREGGVGRPDCRGALREPQARDGGVVRLIACGWMKGL